MADGASRQGQHHQALVRRIIMTKKTGLLLMSAVVLFGLAVLFRPFVTSSMSPAATPSPTPAAKQYQAAPPISIDQKKTYTAVIQTNKGAMTVGLFAQEAPTTVNNFVFLAREGFYAGTPFHRIIKGFMIQGGDPTGTGMGSPGYRFNDEPIKRDYTKGTIAMANSGPNTNGSQFFIMHADYPLPKNYVIFGAIAATDSASLATLDAIASVPVGISAGGEMSAPREALMVESVTIQEQ